MNIWPPDPTNPSLFFVQFGLLWLAITTGLSIFSGWRILCSRFPDERVQGGEKFRFASLSMGTSFFPVNYSNCVAIEAGTNGFRISLWLLFRLFHPPMFIPWSQVSSIESKSWLFFFRFSRVQLRNSSVKIDVMGRPGVKLKELYDHVYQ
jgi:hypothetical protein